MKRCLFLAAQMPPEIRIFSRIFSAGLLIFAAVTTTPRRQLQQRLAPQEADLAAIESALSNWLGRLVKILCHTSCESAENMKQRKSAQIAFLVYFLVTMSKKFWLPSLSGANFWIADISCFVCLPALLIMMFKLPLIPKTQSGNGQIKLHDMGSLLFLSFITALAIGVLNIVGSVVGAKIARHFPEILPRVIDYAGHIPETGILSVLVVFYFALTAGYVEEFFFRGLLGSIISDAFQHGRVIFIVLSAISFALIHWGSGLANVITTFMQGVLLSIVLVRTRDVRIVMLGHGLFWLKWLF